MTTVLPAGRREILVNVAEGDVDRVLSALEELFHSCDQAIAGLLSETEINEPIVRAKRGRVTKEVG